MEKIKSEILLGRTNQYVSQKWWALNPENINLDTQKIEKAAEYNIPLDITNSTPYWGNLLYDLPNTSPIVLRCGASLSDAENFNHAVSLVQSHLLSNLCSTRRECINYYVLKPRDSIDLTLLDGALESLESAREDSLIKHIGLDLTQNTENLLNLWIQRDAFEFIIIPNHTEKYDILSSIAKSKNVGIVISKNSIVENSSDNLLSEDILKNHVVLDMV